MPIPTKSTTLILFSPARALPCRNHKADSMDIVESVKSVLAPPHKAGYPFIVGGIAVAVLGLLLWHPLTWLGLLFTLFCLYFFRDPERILPPRPNVLVAPAAELAGAGETPFPPPEIGL